MQHFDPESTVFEKEGSLLYISVKKSFFTFFTFFLLLPIRQHSTCGATSLFISSRRLLEFQQRRPLTMEISAEMSASAGPSISGGCVAITAEIYPFGPAVDRYENLYCRQLA